MREKDIKEKKITVQYSKCCAKMYQKLPKLRGKKNRAWKTEAIKQVTARHALHIRLSEKSLNWSLKSIMQARIQWG